MRSRNQLGPKVIASVVATVCLSLAALSLAFPASVSADGSGDAEHGGHQHTTTDRDGETNAVDTTDSAAHPPESPPTQEPPKPQGSSAPPTRAELLMLWPQPELEPGHDKCKRFRGYPLPEWCFGLSSWPVLKARAITAKVIGIRDAGPRSPTRRKRVRASRRKLGNCAIKAPTGGVVLNGKESSLIGGGGTP
jgi:hypothetical protein